MFTYRNMKFSVTHFYMEGHPTSTFINVFKPVSKGSSEMKLIATGMYLMEGNNYSKSNGRKQALRDALLRIKMSKAGRTAIWKLYFKTTGGIK